MLMQEKSKTLIVADTLLVGAQIAGISL